MKLVNINKELEYCSRQNQRGTMKTSQHMLAFWGKAGLLAIVAMFLFWKSKFGFGNIDESFYICLSQRLWQGDALLVHEWSLQQLSGFVTLPLYALHMKVFGSTDGIILHFRYVYVVFMLMAATYHYLCFRKYADSGAFYGALAFAMSAPFGIMALSYNSLGVIFFSLSVSTFVCASRWRFASMVFGGVCFAISVLACPFLILAYFMFGISSCLRKTLKLEFFPFSIGCGVIAIIFLYFCLSRATFADIFQALPYFFDDPDHMNKSFLIVLRDWLGHFFLVQKWWSLVLLVAVFAVFLNRQVRMKDESAGWQSDFYYLIVYLIVMLLMMLVVLVIRPWSDFFALPVCVIATVCIPMSRNPKTRRIGIYGVAPAYVYGFCTCLGTNQGSYLVASVMFVSVVPATVILFRTVHEFLSKNSLGRKAICIRAVICANMLVLIFGMTYCRYRMVWWDAPMADLGAEIECGPEKGLYTTQIIKSSWYDKSRESIVNSVPSNVEDRVFFHCSRLWLYLCVSNKMASYSAWTTGAGPALYARMDRYWSLHPNRVPKFALVREGERELLDGLTLKYHLAPVGKLGDACILKKD